MMWFSRVVCNQLPIWITFNEQFWRENSNFYPIFAFQVKYLISHCVSIFDVLKDDGIKKGVYNLKSPWNEIQFFIWGEPQCQKGFYLVHVIRRPTCLEILSQSLKGLFPLPYFIPQLSKIIGSYKVEKRLKSIAKHRKNYGTHTPHCRKIIFFYFYRVFRNAIGADVHSTLVCLL